jgi:hypothetical protein
MTAQSPKSRRGHAPGETPAVDNNPVTKSGGSRPEHKASSLAKSKEHVPKKSATGWDGAGKGIQSGYASVPVHSPAPSQAGKPGYASDHPEASKNPSGGNACSYPRGGKR